ncbi:hypothetical protein SmJEL517_g03097 [Synchytrium microbalum]|uniref:Structural maintenance of chromosomes protein n=1 Tax=Synchytrium microbalum TaxID=1806994 RepID=A0A507C844_9FUNG|nr:uncharacterized protein SmJEL517_g03097 [Synchytrium microbalum]TPX34166.1 hypothetical protein SmJEL517_g03097 [Synchytrium microbalum]
MARETPLEDPEGGRLIRIELKDFKSYRGHQVIGPLHNFVAVIGPNGSGKSNLMDAISFVLGVKSTQLRSNQLKELIYRGARIATKKKVKQPIKIKGKGKKRPHKDDDEEDDEDDDVEEAQGDDDEDQEDDDADEDGQVKNPADPTKAWVAAIYRTSEGREIRFTRTVTATGTSEYKINDKTVTYSKYNDTLKDENILVKARNFLVFQGDIEAIASQSPKDLTKLIEQITEYDRLKALQEQATETSTLNFNKKRGINAEMKQVKEQKEEADRFAKLQRQRAKATVTYLAWKLYHLQASVEGLRGEVTEAKDGFADLTKELAGLEAELREEKVTQSNTNKEVIRVEKKIKDKTKEIDRRKPETMKLDEKISHSTRKITTAENSKAAAEIERDKQNQEIEKLEAKVQAVQKAFEKFENDMRKELKSRAGAVLTENDLSEYRQKKAELNGRIAPETQKLGHVQRGLTTEVETKNRLEEKCRIFETKHESLVKEREDLKQRREKALSRDTVQAELRTMEADARRLSQQELELNEKITEMSNRLSQARSDRHATEKEAKLKDCLKTLRQTFNGVHGRLVDICKPTQRKYDLAVTVVLGKNMDAVVVDDQKTALECIQYLKEQRAGKVTFLPMDSLLVKPINEKYREFHKGARLVIDVIQFDAQYERAVQFACNNAIVCDTMDVARHICYERNQEVKAVVLDGTIIHKNANITGGATQNSNAARRWEEKDLDAFKQAKEGHSAELREVSKELYKVRHVEPVQAQLATLQAKLTSLNDEINTIDRRLAAVDQQMQHGQVELAKLQPQFQKSKATVETLEAQRTDLETIIHEAEDEIFADFCRRIKVPNIRDYEAHETRLGQDFERKRLEHTRQKAQLDTEIKHRNQSVAEVVERIRRVEASIETDTTLLAKLQGEKDGLENIAHGLAEEIRTFKEELKASKERSDDTAVAVARLKKEVQRVTKDIEGRNKGVTQKEAQIEKLLSETFSILRRCKLEEIDLPLAMGSLDDVPLAEAPETLNDDRMQVDNENRHPWMEEIEVDYSGLKKEQRNNGTEEMDAKLQDDIRNIVDEIEKMAPNLRAADNLERVQDKLRATVADFDDARKHATAAARAFETIKKDRAERFQAAFAHIEKHIDKVYKELTKSKTFPMGGTAYLAVEDDEEPYTNGVKYNVMPPMKRFRDMDQLSGGEKTVAALALLLAIHSYKPAPFFVLDEVDAALDNANVARVANYIRAHANDDFQFIVISLKNTFYEKAQALVGIYRDSINNSSKVLTLKLDGNFEE